MLEGAAAVREAAQGRVRAGAADPVLTEEEPARLTAAAPAR
ncbi:hypothetical protein ACIBJF_48615 [Streptomyces sp. NPDC050743]